MLDESQALSISAIPSPVGGEMGSRADARSKEAMALSLVSKLACAVDSKHTVQGYLAHKKLTLPNPLQ